MINGMHFSLHFSSLLNSSPFHSTCQIQTHVHSHMAAAWDALSGATPISQRSQPYLFLYYIYPDSQFGVQYLQHASSVWLCPKQPVCHYSLCHSWLCVYVFMASASIKISVHATSLQPPGDKSCLLCQRKMLSDETERRKFDLCNQIPCRTSSCLETWCG